MELQLRIRGLIFTLLFLQINFTYSEQISQRNRFTSLPKKDHAESIEERVDYSNGFPSGFTQGLPTFDFSGSMTASNAEPNAEDTENVGFVHGPPEGFPSLSQLGVNFPSFGDDAQSQPTLNQPQRPFNPTHSLGPTSSYYQQNHQNSFQVHSPQSPIENYPGHSHDPSSYGADHSPIDIRNPTVTRRRRPIRPLALTRIGPNSSRQQHYQPSETVRTPEGTTQYNHQHGSHNQLPQHQATKPIVLKVSSKKTRPTKLPPPPPPFYAPSPDLQVNNHKNNAGHPGSAHSQRYTQQHYRTRRAIIPINQSTSISDQTADGSETYWDVESPFILFDHYQNNKEKETSESEASNRSAIDPDAGEQRFFPSFPIPNPYLGLNPYVSPPSGRPPLFPGPNANRAPSRYHPQFGSTKYSQASIPPNRGPSGVYSAENHDHHGDRYQDNNLLGSGNFEVVRGGTYYEDDDHSFHPGFHHGGPDHHQGEDDYYHHNGHSSPTGFQQPGTDFFANFRDFADINPPSRSFSHNYETLSLEPAASERSPKNILDKLESRSDSGRDLHLIDKEIDPMMATY